MSTPSEIYENDLVPTLFAPAADFLIDIARPQPGESVLDVACGTGICFRKAAQYIESNGTFTGVDRNPNNIAVARDVADRDGITVELHEGDAADLPFPDDSFDLVLCGMSWMYFKDKSGSLAEMRRVLTNGGRAAISVWQEFSNQSQFEQAYWKTVADHLGVAIQDLAMPFQHTVPDLEAFMIRAGFENVEIAERSFSTRYPNPDPEQWLEEGTRGTLEVVAAFDELDESEQERLIDVIVEELVPSVSELIEDNHVVQEYHTYIARGDAPA